MEFWAAIPPQVRGTYKKKIFLLCLLIIILLDSQTQQTLLTPHRPIGTPPCCRQVRVEKHVPFIDCVNWLAVPGISVETEHDGPEFSNRLPTFKI